MPARPSPSRRAPEEIDAYLAGLPEDEREALDRLRGIIRETVPDATERVSYGIPMFRLGKDLLGISSAKNHLSLHTLSPTVATTLSDELDGVVVSGATIRFTPAKPLSDALILRVIRARMEEIEAPSATDVG